MGGDAPHAFALQVDAPPAQLPDTVVYFRKLVAADIEQVRGLHETWFPIRYNQVRPKCACDRLLVRAEPIGSAWRVCLHMSTPRCPTP